MAGFKDIKPEQGFKKGTTGNPKGRPKVFGENAGVVKMSADHLARTITRYFNMPMGEILTRNEDHLTPAYELVICSSILRGWRTGKFSAISGLVDRVIGKPKEMVAMDITMSAREALAAIPPDVIIQYLRAQMAPAAILSESDKT